jgi:hypothetical protein
MGRIAGQKVGRNFGQKVHEDPSPNITRAKWTGGVAHCFASAKS